MTARTAPGAQLRGAPPSLHNITLDAALEEMERQADVIDELAERIKGEEEKVRKLKEDRPKHLFMAAGAGALLSAAVGAAVVGKFFKRK